MIRLQLSQVHIHLLGRRPQDHHCFNRNILPKFRDPNLHSLPRILSLFYLRLLRGSLRLSRTRLLLLGVLRYSILLQLLSRPILLKFNPTRLDKAMVHRPRMIGTLPPRCLTIMELYQVPTS